MEKQRTRILFYQWTQESNVQYEIEVRCDVPLDRYNSLFKAVITKEQFTQLTKGLECKPMPGGLYYSI